MNEIINSILEAESYAEKILKDASAKSKNISKMAIFDSDKIKENAILDFKDVRKSKILKAEKKADEEYNKKFKEGETNAESIISSVLPKVDKVIEETLNNIIR